jgi:AAA15 family ATPase/GTPase
MKKTIFFLLLVLFTKTFISCKKDNNNTIDNLLVGITFYSYLNDMDDEKLAEADFSRDKIQDGITKLLSAYGLENMANLFFYET